MQELTWLEETKRVTLVRKDCINGFIGATQPDGRNVFVDWIQQNQLKDIIVAGICTDICVMNFELTVLSARNHGRSAPSENYRGLCRCLRDL
ncbi:MAG: isochorismatase family protein [Verrucomicrobiota bacterium]